MDRETLVAYTERQLLADTASRTEQHLLSCTACTAEVQRLIRLRRTIGTVATTGPAAPAAGRVPRRWRDSFVAMRESARRFFDQPLPALGALAATVMLLVIVTRIVPLSRSNEGVTYRGREAKVEVETIADDVLARARPGDGELLVARLAKGTIAARLEEHERWTRIELSDGRRVWVRSGDVSTRQRLKP